MSIGKVIRKYRKEKNMTQEEIDGIIYELNEKLKTMPYEECFRWVREKLEEYPNCEWLILSAAVVLEAQLLIQDITDSEGWEDYIVTLFERALHSSDEKLRIRAADSLFGLYMRKKQYDRAESYLAYFSSQNPDRKIKLAEIYRETGRTQEAYKEYEELLFDKYGHSRSNGKTPKEKETYAEKSFFYETCDRS